MLIDGTMGDPGATDVTVEVTTDDCPTEAVAVTDSV
jgi:hypothetical protein